MSVKTRKITYFTSLKLEGLSVYNLMEKRPAVACIGLNRATLWSPRVHMRAINVIVQIFKLIKINSLKSRPQVRMKWSRPQNIIPPLSIETPVSNYSYFEELQVRCSPALCDGSGLENIHFRNLCGSDKPSGEVIFTPSGWWWEAVCSYWCSKYRKQEKENSPLAPKTILIETEMSWRSISDWTVSLHLL